jgi:hypothetical protein
MFPLEFVTKENALALTEEGDADPVGADGVKVRVTPAGQTPGVTTMYFAILPYDPG